MRQETQMKVWTIAIHQTLSSYRDLTEGLGMRLTVGALKALTTARASTSYVTLQAGQSSGSGEGF